MYMYPGGAVAGGRDSAAPVRRDTHSHPLSLTLTLTHSLTLTLTHSHSLSLTLTHSHSLSRTHSHSPSLTLTHSHSPTLTHSRSLSQSHPHSRPVTHSHKYPGSAVAGGRDSAAAVRRELNGVHVRPVLAHPQFLFQGFTVRLAKS
jgi:hypothetical protein